MEPDGRTKIIYQPSAELVEALEQMSKVIRDFGASMQDLQWPKPPTNERPWHKHTLPNRKKRR